jgi:CubicO group peptidase (beta-lactamase class C family)
MNIYHPILTTMKQRYTLYLFLLVVINVQAQQLYFPPTTGSTWDTLHPNSLNYCADRIDSLYEYLDQTDSKAFILLKDGKIVLERYFDNFTQDSVWYWASAGKSLTACLVGIAQQEGFLSIEDTTSQYLGAGWTSASTAQEQAITIKNQLCMTTGLLDNGDCTLDTCLQYLTAAGSRWAYHNAPYTLLDQVLEQATGRTLNTYLFQKVKQITGMTGLYLPLGYNNVYWSNARSMARFGLLGLNHGNWDGTPVLTDTSYFRAMTTPSQNLNPAYGYLWWLNGQSSYQLPGLPLNINGPLNPNAPSDLIMALGKNGQAVNIVPSQNLVWIRMGNAPVGSNILHQYNDSIWIKINQLDCSTNNTTKLLAPANLHLYPNPTNSVVQVQSEQAIGQWQLHNSLGQVVQAGSKSGQQAFQVDLSQLPQGCYYLKVTYENGQRAVYTVLRE